MGNNYTDDSWTMSQEREFIENLLSQRFNFFLVFYSIIIAGLVTVKNEIYVQIILMLGAIIITLLASVLKRSQQKLDLILEELFKDEKHPAKISDDLAGSGGSRRKLIGIWIPAICYLTLIIGAVVNFIFIICSF